MQSLYALMHKDTKKLVGFYSTPNGDDAEFCNESTVTLYELSDEIWVTTNKEVAERVSTNTVPWYNSDYNSPKNPYVGKLQVVEYILKE